MKRRMMAKGAALLMAALSAACILWTPTESRADSVMSEFYTSEYDVDYYVVVKAKDGINVRYGAGTDNKIFQWYPTGTIFHVFAEIKLSSGKKWEHVTYMSSFDVDGEHGAVGQDGWIAMSQCKKISETGEYYYEGNNEHVEYDDVDYYVKANDSTSSGLNLRFGPGTEYARCFGRAIPNGTRLEIIAEATAKNGRKWGLTTYKGVDGWVALSQCKR